MFHIQPPVASRPDASATSQACCPFPGALQEVAVRLDLARREKASARQGAPSVSGLEVRGWDQASEHSNLE